MNGPDELDSTSPSAKHALLQRSRREFPAFYASATLADALLMDALVLVSAAFHEGVTARRSRLPWPVRTERTCDETELAFVGAREAVRLSPSFQALPMADQMRIAGVLFDVSAHSG